MLMGKVLYVVDTSNWLYKFSAVFKRTTNVNGVEVDTSALFGLVRAVKSSPFSDIVFVLDATPELSNNLLPSYKGQRDSDGLASNRVSFPTLVKVLSSLGKRFAKNVMVAVSPGQEADQVISSIAHLVTDSHPINSDLITELNHGVHTLDSDSATAKLSDGVTFGQVDFTTYDKCVIGTTDSDMYQLMRLKNVFIDTSTNGSKIVYAEEAPKAVHNIPYNCIPGYKLLVGDISDNVPSANVPSLKKHKLIDFVIKYLNSLENCRKFIKDCSFGTSGTSDYDLVVKEIQAANQVSVIKRNFKVTCLQYYSTPYILTYPEFNLEKVLRKYRIKI